MPADLSVVVIGWSGLTKHIVPRLTHVDVPALEMANAAVELRPEEDLPSYCPPSSLKGER